MAQQNVKSRLPNGARVHQNIHETARNHYVCFIMCSLSEIYLNKVTHLNRTGSWLDNQNVRYCERSLNFEAMLDYSRQGHYCVTFKNKIILFILQNCYKKYPFLFMDQKKNFQ